MNLVDADHEALSRPVVGADDLDRELVVSLIEIEGAQRDRVGRLDAGEIEIDRLAGLRAVHVELDDGIRFQADSVHSEEILSLRRTYSGLTGTSQTYTLANDEADSGLGRPNALLRIELEANRSGVTSLQKHSVSFERAGYGLHYDKYYGESPRVS